MKIGAIGIRTKIIVGDAATWYLVKKYLDNVVIKGGITPEEKAKLAGIEDNANNYEHPETHPASILDVVDVVNGAANKFLNERGEMVAVATSSIGVTGSPLYASTANSDVAGYKSLVGTPQDLETEITLTAKSTNGIVWGDKYLSAPFTEAVTIPTTAYGFDYWRKVSAANGTSRKHLRVFLYRAGVETNIITPLASPEIDEIEFTERQISYIFPELALLAGDRIGIQEGFSTTHANNITLTYIVGDGRGWFMRLPLPLKHESLTNKNSEAAFQHVDTTVTKSTLDEADMVAIKDSVTGKMVLTPKSNLQTAVVQSTGTSETDVMSQKAVTTELAAKELKSNKQNSLAPDGTGTKFPTVDAVNAGLVLKQDANLIASYIHSGNLEVAVQSIDIASNTFTKTAHGLINGDRVAPILNINVVDAYPYNVYPIGLANPDNGYYVINATNDTFQLSLTSGGASITLSTNATMNLTKWHFEKRIELVYENTNILFSTDFRIVYGLRILTSSNFYSYNGISGIWSGNDYYPSSSNYNNTYIYPYTPINPCHFGHGEQKFMSHYMMNSIHLIARIHQTGIVDRLSIKFIDISKTVNSEQIQSKTLRLASIFPANGFSFKIYKI